MKVISTAACGLLGASLLFGVVGAPLRQVPTALRHGDGTSGWSWPLAPVPKVVRAFDPPAQRWLSGHRGADLGADPGAAVLAPVGGIVSFVGVVVDRPVIVIDHGAGLRSSFEPVRSSLGVGALVTTGDEIGIVGTGSHCNRLCMHWGLRLFEEYIDPLLTIRDTRPSVLLPKQDPG
ncbi:M23 family metallopeptidase [Paeniglutamicibacter sp. NPDC012692]|uniref:M23 family metallopeptidase n=1 Tax=Paeniglutamicibacter sp. NPDC012692 TaxID=3364388 RepID=UPI0036BE629F